MQITNPSELPTLQGQIETLQVRITLAMAELDRLIALNTGELYTVSQLNIQKKDLEERIGGLMATEEKLTSQVDELTSEKTDLENNNLKIKDKFIEEKSRLADIETSLTERGNTIKQQEEIVYNKTKELEVIRLSFEQEKNLFLEKIAQIKSLTL
jgi:chromosome segregation ATPase